MHRRVYFIDQDLWLLLDEDGEGRICLIVRQIHTSVVRAPNSEKKYKLHPVAYAISDNLRKLPRGKLVLRPRMCFKARKFDKYCLRWVGARLFR